MKITKAIIPVAGYGTRRLPITKALEKCMLPVCNRPIIDYVVEECVLAGITDLFFVVSDDFEQLRDYYSRNTQLEEYLTKRGKMEALEDILKISEQANFHYIVQDQSGAYGTAVPVWIARDAVEQEEHFVVLMGDDFMFYPNGGNDLKRMMHAIEEHDTAGAILGVQMDEQKISLYGSIVTKEESGVELFNGMVEKPEPGRAPSLMANVSNYIFDKKIFPYLDKVLETPNESGEHYLTDAVNDYTNAGNNMAVVRSTGTYLDGGNLAGWIEANNTVFSTLQK
ncbi:MAG TPA: sugar phosphate nucleotidyltransferase [Candidatus Saccharimonadales bacterium]|nr:sugar phosphate nucleotidyltransferase [Candidatus Saccharimonadales bacterium]